MSLRVERSNLIFKLRDCFASLAMTVLGQSGTVRCPFRQPFFNQKILPRGSILLSKLSFISKHQNFSPTHCPPFVRAGLGLRDGSGE